MIIDKDLTVSTSQAVTASAASTDYIDLGAARDVGQAGLCFVVTCDESATAAGAGTMSISLQCDDNTSFSSAKTLSVTDAFAKTVLTAGREPIYIPLPTGLDERYVRLYYTVGTGPLTAGKFTAGVVAGVQSNKAYADAL